MPLQIIRDDITRVKADAIVNAANSGLKEGGGVCGAIFAAAGAEPLQAACDAIGHCDVSQAVMTPGFGLPARYIIHTVGPVWRGGSSGEEALLYDCYRHSLELARQHRLASIAFPLISSGIFLFPKDRALRVAIAAIGDFLLQYEMIVHLVIFDQSSFVLTEKVFSQVQQFIDDHYVEEYTFSRNRGQYVYSLEWLEPKALPAVKETVSDKGKRHLDDVLKQLDETFPQMLLRLIDERGLRDVDVYKKANIDRKLFSKIRGDSHYRASRQTALAFAIALELSLDETRDLLGKAGYALSRSSKFDVIVEYFIEQKNYNVFEINEALFAFDQPLLGAT